MATKIAVMDTGVIQQVGTPDEIYDQPENVFVADFVGSPAMNMLDRRGRGGANGAVEAVARRARADFRSRRLSLAAAPPGGQPVKVGFRPEHFVAAGRRCRRQGAAASICRCSSSRNRARRRLPSSALPSGRRSPCASSRTPPRATGAGETAAVALAAQQAQRLRRARPGVECEGENRVKTREEKDDHDRNRHCDWQRSCSPAAAPASGGRGRTERELRLDLAGRGGGGQGASGAPRPDGGEVDRTLPSSPHDTGANVSVVNMIAGGTPPDVFLEAEPRALSRPQEAGPRLSADDLYDKIDATPISRRREARASPSTARS